MASHLRLQRNLALLGFMVMIITNLILGMIILGKDHTTILVPSIENRLSVSLQKESPEYLKIRAEEVHYLLFGMNKENADRTNELLLQHVDNGLRHEFKQQIEKLAEDIKQKEYHYNFADIIKYDIDANNKQVKISGYLETYIAGQRINKEFKTYLYQFINRGGLVLLYSFKEVADEK